MRHWKSAKALNMVGALASHELRGWSQFYLHFKHYLGICDVSSLTPQAMESLSS